MFKFSKKIGVRLPSEIPIGELRPTKFDYYSDFGEMYGAVA